MIKLERLRTYIGGMTELVTSSDSEPVLLDEGARLLADLVRHDDWLPKPFAAASGEGYRQYLLHCDPLERFSVVSFVWGPGQHTPIHDHTVWGLIGMLRGRERCEEYSDDVDPRGEHLLAPGEIDRVSPTIGDVHRVSNALENEASISIHVYGGNIGAVSRHVYDAGTRAPSAFISGYSRDVVPNLWDRSTETRTGR